MAPSIETIDNLPKVQPRDRVHELDRSKEEQDQEAFKKALKRKMQQQGDDDEAEEEALIVDIDLSKQEQELSHESAAAPEGTDEATEPEPNGETGDKDTSPAPPDHIDLKA